MSDSLQQELGMQASRVSNERGMALAVAIFALVVIGALVAGTFFAGRVEQQSGQNTFYASQASEAAEAAMAQTLAGSLGAATMLALPKLDNADRPVVRVAGRTRGRHVLAQPPHEQRLARERIGRAPERRGHGGRPPVARAADPAEPAQHQGQRPASPPSVR